jgi:hypothetical protein
MRIANRTEYQVVITLKASLLFLAIDQNDSLGSQSTP